MKRAAKRTVAALGVVLIGAAASRHAGVAAPAAQEEQPPADRGTIAVLRRDGLIAPFASFRGTGWRVAWPRDLRNLELPVNVASIPERWWGGETPEAWQAWPIGGTPRPLTPVAPQIYPIHCAQRLGLRTDYTPQLVPPPVQVEPYPKDGIAVSGGARVEPIETLDPGPGWSELAILLLEDFNRAEDREVSMISSVFSHPVARDERRREPVRIESWYRTTLDDKTTVSYIEAVRSYPPGPDDEECGLETLVGGWVTHEKGKPEPRADLHARITYCDRVGATFMQPFGRIRVRDRVYWISQVAGAEAEWYTVAHLAPGRIQFVAEYLAGSRDSCLGVRSP